MFVCLGLVVPAESLGERRSCNWAPFVIGYFVGQWYVALSFKGVFVQGVCRKKRKSGAEFLFSVSLGCNIDLSILLHHSLAGCHCLTDAVHINK